MNVLRLMHSLLLALLLSAGAVHAQKIRSVTGPAASASVSAP